MDGIREIDWVRHGESCANYLDHKFVDDYEDTAKRNRRTANIDRIVACQAREVERQSCRAQADRNVTCPHVPPIFRQYESDVVERVMPKRELEQLKGRGVDVCPAINVDETWAENTGDADAAHRLYTRNVLIRSSWLYQPPLTYVGILQAQRFGRDFLKPNLSNYGLFITSGTARAIMTGILALLEAGSSGPLVVVPYINERSNWAGPYDNANMSIPPAIIDKVIHEIKSFLNNPYLPTVDTSLYKEVAKRTDDETVRRLDLDRFYTEILPNLTPIGGRIMAFVHGYVINNISRTSGHKGHPGNTVTWRQRIKGSVPVSATEVFPGVSVRSTIDEFEGPQLCTLDSLRGKINAPYIDYERTKVERLRRAAAGQPYSKGGLNIKQMRLYLGAPTANRKRLQDLLLQRLK